MLCKFKQVTKVNHMTTFLRQFITLEKIAQMAEKNYKSQINFCLCGLA